MQGRATQHLRVWHNCHAEPRSTYRDGNPVRLDARADEVGRGEHVRCQEHRGSLDPHRICRVLGKLPLNFRRHPRVHYELRSGLWDHKPYLPGPKLLARMQKSALHYSKVPHPHYKVVHASSCKVAGTKWII